MPRYSIPGCTAKFSERPGALEYVLANYKLESIADLSRSTGVSYTNVAQALLRRGLMADRYTRRGLQIQIAERLSENERAYLAGIIDGEGTITIAAKKNTYYRPAVTISNTSTLLRDWLSRRGFDIVLAINNNGRPYWRLMWSGYQLDRFLSLVRPFLVIKARHCDLVLEFISIRRAQSKRAPPTEHMLAIVSILHWLNERRLSLAERERRDTSLISLPSITSSRQLAS